MTWRLVGVLTVLLSVSAQEELLFSQNERVMTMTEFVEMNRNKALHPDARVPVETLVRNKGYTYDMIKVTTADGYICQMFQVTDPLQTSNLGPVILQHGILDSSDTWVLDEETDSFAMLLAKEGYTVFMPNNRGNKYCKEHTHLPSEHELFWQFSWDEMAAHDIPAFVDTVLNATGASSVVYIAHSQGTTQMFAALTLHSTLADKISTFVALAPVVFIQHTTSSLVSELANLGADRIVARFGKQEFLPTSSILEFALPHICNNWATRWMCEWGMWMVTGYSWREINTDRLPVYMAHFPSGTSVLNGVHWAQSVRSDKDYSFRRLDLNQVPNEGRTNRDVYGQDEPPIYDLKSIPMDKVDITVFSGSLDPLANPTDVQLLVETLPVKPKWIPLDGYDHMTFLWGRNAARDVYQPVLEDLKKKFVENLQLNPSMTPSPTTQVEEIAQPSPLPKPSSLLSHGSSTSSSPSPLAPQPPLRQAPAVGAVPIGPNPRSSSTSHSKHQMEMYITGGLCVLASSLLAYVVIRYARSRRDSKKPNDVYHNADSVSTTVVP